MKATHDGTCQVCGRRQAARFGARMAKHGYKVADAGWFVGTCSGSDRAPLELETDLLDDTVTMLTRLAETAEATRPEDIAEVSVTWTPHDVPARKPEPIHMTLCGPADVAAYYVRRPFVAGRMTWPEWQAQEVRRRHARAAQLRAHVETLGRLRAERHGQPLHPRAVSK